jgi:hypothetical protein
MSEQSHAAVGALLVGSMPFKDATEVFEQSCACLGSHLKRLPDGETDERRDFTIWKAKAFETNPHLEIDADAEGFTVVSPTRTVSLPPFKVRDDIPLSEADFQVGYDRRAIASYREFKLLKEDGKIPAHLRFQVSMPTPIAVTLLLGSPNWKNEFFEAYQAHAIREVRNILKTIPHEELALQWDTVAEIVVYETGMFWEFDYKPVVANMFREICDFIPEAVELGIHICYGTLGDRHSLVPKDATIMAGLANDIAAAVSRRIDYVHFPIQPDCLSDDFYAPFQQLSLGKETEVYLGLIHESGNEDRIAVASRHVQRFGVAGECGFGRKSPENVIELLQKHAAAAAPVA